MIIIPGRTQSSVREEKLYNPRLTKSEEEFATIMENLGEQSFCISQFYYILYSPNIFMVVLNCFDV